MNLSKWVMPYGKHKGESLGDIPAHYLLWFADQANPPPEKIDSILILDKE